MRNQLGHRQRVKDRFSKEGLDNFADVHALELLLFYAIPRKDTKPIARRLLDIFGTLTGVLEASPEALKRVEGVGPNTALYLSLINHMGRYVATNRDDGVKIFRDMNECGEYLVNFFRGRHQEEVWMLCLDAKSKLLSCQKVCEGGPGSVSVSPRRVIELALSVNASSVVLAHNHTNGMANPSSEDIAVTYMLARGMNAVGVILVDHIVVSDGDFTSMYQSGGYDPQVRRPL